MATALAISGRTNSATDLEMQRSAWAGTCGLVENKFKKNVFGRQ